jgi:hypothetical protein
VFGTKIQGGGVLLLFKNSLNVVLRTNFADENFQ